MSQHVAIIGAGLGGLATAALLAKDGYSVTLYEKNSMPGGRAIMFEAQGFRFDMGPSWYLMPDAFELFFNEFGRKPSDYYTLLKLDPSYKVFFSDNESVVVRPDREYMLDLFNQMEPGAGGILSKHLEHVEKKYRLGFSRYLMKDYRSLTDIFERDMVRNLSNMELFESYHHSIAKKFGDKRIQKILEFMVVFLGGSPYKVPGLYNLINWADFGLHVYYPEGGFSRVAKGFERLAHEQGVTIRYQSTVSKIIVKNKKAIGLIVNGAKVDADIVIANADYAYVENALLEEADRVHGERYWRGADVAPSGLCIFLGIRGMIPHLEHHTLIFNEDWARHFQSIERGTLPKKPQYYVSTPTKTDKYIAPSDCENICILIPLASGLQETTGYKESLYEYALIDLENKTGYPIRSNIVTKRLFGVSDFHNSYNAYAGNAFGLGHTLKHSAFLRPKNFSTKVRDLYFVGHFTNPGTGTPLVVLSGIVVRNLVRKIHGGR
jgi:phytoene desaturase